MFHGDSYLQNSVRNFWPIAKKIWRPETSKFRQFTTWWWISLECNKISSTENGVASCRHSVYTYAYALCIWWTVKGKGKGRALVIAPQIDTATTEALRYMARTKQRRTYLPLDLPSRSRYSFTDPERMEGWVSPGQLRVQRATGPRLLCRVATVVYKQQKQDRSFDQRNGRPSYCALSRILVMSFISPPTHRETQQWKAKIIFNR